MITPTTHTTVTDLEHTLREIDRLIHHSQELLRHTIPAQGISGVARAWEAAAGLWKGKLTEDSLVYQRRIRNEE